MTSLIFHHSEHVQFSFLAKNRDGTTLTSPATATFRMDIAETPGGTALLQFSTAGAQIVLGDSGTARFDITLSAADLATLAEGRTYHTNFWVTTAGGTIIGQKSGTLYLERSIQYT